MQRPIELSGDVIAEFCRRRRVRRMAFFGSVLRGDYTPMSDVDVLVEFEATAGVGLLGLAGTVAMDLPSLIAALDRAVEER